MWIERVVLSACNTQPAVSGPKEALVGAILQPVAAPKLADAGLITLNGDPSALQTYGGVMDEFDQNFEIIAP